MVQADPPASVGVHVEGPNQHSPEDAVVLNTLSYAYSGHRPIVSDISLTLPKGSRCLLLGANGAGQPRQGLCSLRKRSLLGHPSLFQEEAGGAQGHTAERTAPREDRENAWLW